MGLVIAAKMQKTVTVLIEYHKKDRRVEKVIRRSKKLLVHDEEGRAKVGDVVKIVETRPLSRRKRHRLLEIIKSSSGTGENYAADAIVSQSSG